MKNKSAIIDALVTVTDYIHKTLDSNRKMIGIFLDITKAFNSVNHTIL